ncbi:MAG: Holliday junction DNA helicase RuvB [Bdellovibrionales bacterium GWA2_49_15]|nr:MAG: Holliday junction DNA helicase RuvB [Bdellovibrionales bacterium GWA2_49_15]
MEIERIVDAQADVLIPEEQKIDARLRPTCFKEFVGQERVIENIKIMVQSAKLRKNPLDHILLSGPPGLGKTSLAMIMAQELGVELHIVSGPSLDKKGDLAALLTNLNKGDVLFIDEIHRMPVTVEEILYAAMEDYRLDILIGQGASAKTMQIEINPFTLIGATTRSGLLTNPLRDRFLAHFHFDFYSAQELGRIIDANQSKLGISIAPKAIEKMAYCSRGTPRIANRILRRLRDYVLVHAKNAATLEDIDQALRLMEVDGCGLDRMDRKILRVIRDFYQGGPIGIEALCATLNEDRTTIEDVYEPFLLKEGLLIRTPRGREISEKAVEHLAKNDY